MKTKMTMMMAVPHMQPIPCFILCPWFARAMVGFRMYVHMYMGAVDGLLPLGTVSILNFDSVRVRTGVVYCSTECYLQYSTTLEQVTGYDLCNKGRHYSRQMHGVVYVCYCIQLLYTYSVHRNQCEEGGSLPSHPRGCSSTRGLLAWISAFDLTARRGGRLCAALPDGSDWADAKLDGGSLLLFFLFRCGFRCLFLGLGAGLDLYRCMYGVLRTRI